MTDALSSLVGWSVLFTVAVACLALVRPWLRRRGGAALLYASWWCVPVVLACALLPRPRMPPNVAQVVVPMQAAVVGGQAVGSTGSNMLATALLAAWVLGAALVAAGMDVGHGRFLRRVHRGPFGWRVPAGASAALVGCFPARVVLPLDFRLRYTAMQRRLVLAHERVHAQRFDNFWTLWACALLVLQWFNPLAWWALRRFRSDQELACDAAVLRRYPTQRRAYALALTTTQGARALALVSPCSQHPLIERLSMLNHPLTPLRRGVLAGLVLAAAAGSYAAQMEARADKLAPGHVRVLIEVALKGRNLQPLVHMAPAGEVREYPINGADGKAYFLSVSAERRPKDMVWVGMGLKDSSTGEVIASPRLMVRDDGATKGSLEMRDKGAPTTATPSLRIELSAYSGEAAALKR